MTEPPSPIPDQADERQLAYEFAMMEMMRSLLIVVLRDPDPEQFQSRLRAFEEDVVSTIMTGRRYKRLDEGVEGRIKEIASSFVTNLLLSLQAPRTS